MTEDEWLDGLRHLPDETIIQLHFGLQEKIKKHYKLRESGSNLQKAIALCEQQIALSPLTLEAMKRKHQEEVNEYRRVTEHHILHLISITLPIMDISNFLLF